MRALRQRIRAWREERKLVKVDRLDAKRQAEQDARERGELQHPPFVLGGQGRYRSGKR